MEQTNNTNGQVTQSDNTEQATRPDDTGQATRPNNTGQATQPDDMEQATRPDDTGQAAQPNNTGQAIPPSNTGQAKPKIDVPMVVSGVQGRDSTSLSTRESLELEVIHQYCDTLNPDDAPALHRDRLVDALQTTFSVRNAGFDKEWKWTLPKCLSTRGIVELILRTTNICRIELEGGQNVLAVKATSGKYKGVYRCINTAEDATLNLDRIINELKISVKTSEIKEIYAKLLVYAPLRKVTTAPELLPLENGIWNYDTETLIPWDDPRADKYTFLTKCPIPYNPDAKSPRIPDPEDHSYVWDFDNWLLELFSDHEKPEETRFAIWCVLHAAIRYNVNYRKSVWFCNPDGNGANGKSCICDIIEQLVTDVFTIDMEDFGKDFGLMGLVGAGVCICRETQVGKMIDKVASYKAMVTQEPIKINIKYQKPLKYRYCGITVFCQNDYPRVADKTGSFDRRLLIILFNQSFKGDRARPFIQDQALKSPEVLEYIVKRLVEMNVRKFPDFSFMEKNLKEYRINNSPVEEFLEKFCMPEIDEDTGNPLLDDNGNTKFILKWSLLPYGFLYDLFHAYYEEAYHDRCKISYKTFKKEVKNWACQSEYYIVKQSRIGDRMDEAEPMIDRYNLKNWMNRTYLNSKDLLAKCHPIFNTDRYTGLVRL